MKLVPEHIDEVMGFQRGIDPKEAIGIGRLSNITMESIKNAFACVRNYSLEDLENIYRRIRDKSNISLDGVPIEKLSRYEWIEFNNKVVNGIKSLKRRKVKAASPFGEGDLLKVVHGRRTYFGVYNGIDKHGRIKAQGHGVRLAFSMERYTKATPEEEEIFKAEGILRDKKQMGLKIERMKYRISQGTARPFDLIELLLDYEKKFGEEYESTVH